MDPIKDGLNWYQYVAGNPIKYVDISGEYYITKVCNRKTPVCSRHRAAGRRS